MRNTLLFLPFLVFSCAVCTTQPDTSVSRNRSAMASLRSKTVSIYVMCGDTPVGPIGSGVIVGHDTGTTVVVTAAHVVKSVKKTKCSMLVKDWNGTMGKAIPERSLEGPDVASIRVDRELGTVAQLFDKPFLGQRVTCVGWPEIPYKNYIRLSVTRGHVSTLGLGPHMRVSAHIYFGNSGGACFSKDGKVVGIVSHFSVSGVAFGSVVAQPGLYYISHVDNIRMLVD